MIVVKPYGIVYLITNLVNGKKYVGQTVKNVRNRWKNHKSSARRGHKSVICDAIRKHGHLSFSVKILCRCYSRPELDLMEDLHIVLHKTIHKPFGYNRRRGGGAGTFSEETRRMISERQIGRKLPPEWCEAIGNSHRGVKLNVSEEVREQRRQFLTGNKFGAFPRSPEQRARMGHKHTTEEILKRNATRKSNNHDFSGEKNSFFGKKHTEETKEKMRNRVVSEETCRKISESKQGEKGSRFRHDVPTSLMVSLYNSGVSSYRIAKDYNIDVAAVYNRLKKAGVAFRPARRPKKCQTNSP